MRVARFHAPGDIRIEDAPEPIPGPAEIKIRVRAAYRRRAETDELPDGTRTFGPVRRFGRERGVA